MPRKLDDVSSGVRSQERLGFFLERRSTLTRDTRVGSTMAALVLRRLLISSRQTESLICGRSPQQPLATWSERLKRWSSGNRTTKVLSISCGLESFN